MALYQKSVLNKYLKQLEQPKVSKAYKKYVKYFLNPSIQDNIRNSKEEEYQGIFLTELFVNVLDYTLKPNVDFNLVAEYKNQSNSRKADGAILSNNVAIGVIELKGTKTKDLESIRQQAFDYKANQKECVYVITSNYEKLRFYINDATEFEEFNLFELTEERFSLMYLCLQKDNILNNIPLKTKEASIVVEEQITKQFYKDYSVFKRELFRDLVKRNVKRLKSSGDAINVELDSEAKAEQLRLDKNFKLTLFKKSQKLIDRFLFIFFAEDRGLLPPNSTIQILNKWKADVDFGDERPLYDMFKQYFRFLDTGRQGTTNRAEIYAYNGGLFKEDSLLDKLEIDNDLLFKHTQTLASYDFESQVDVNILGHIFENSLNEIESVNAEIEGGDFDKQKSKRKKDGVFYTPKYITKYIVENTIGKLCEEKKNELGFKEEEYFKGRKNRQQATIVKLVEILDTYRDWLLQLTICDPACGSGAFLNQALDFLIKEHNYIDELKAKILGGGLVFSDIENTILENNIYGVDLNEESVEIAKLSLWLRTAQPRRKLNSLNNNIKCGNSLIDSKAVAGDKAFKWQEQFPMVFAKGGFDVIIGNPPYVGEKGHSEIFESLKKIPKWNEFYRRRSNTYYFFIKHGIDILKENGFQSLIIPREFTNADWANKVRQDIIENSKIVEIVDFNNLKVFDDAGTTSLILTQKKQKQLEYNFHFKNLNNYNSIQNDLFDEFAISTKSIKKLISEDYKPWSFNTFEINYSENIIPLGNVFDIAQGLVTGADKITNKHIISSLIDDKFIGRGIFILTLGKDLIIDNNNISLKINDEWIALNEVDKSFIKPYYKPEHLQKWYVDTTSTFVLYVGNNDLTDNIKKYLLQFDKVLLNRSTIIENKIIALNDFENYSIDDIKLNYSSAGAVQKIMRQKKWYLPLYERINVPFDYSKIVVNTKNMNVFTFSKTSLYSSGGGAGGQNFIYLKDNYKKSILKNGISNIENFTMYVNAILNSKLIQFHIQNGQFNQLSTSKIADLPIYISDFETKEVSKNYNEIVNYCNLLIECSIKLNSIIYKFYNYVKSSFPNLDLSRIQDWNDFTFAEFISELNKAIKKSGELSLTKKDEFEWLDLFEENKAKAQILKLEIEDKDKVIDAMVYELYGLSEEEIAIVENS